MPYFEYGDAEFFGGDEAPGNVAEQRRASFFKLARSLQRLAPRSIAMTESLGRDLSDQQMINNYRVPFPYQRLVRDHLKLPNIAEETNGPLVRDLDGNWNFDLAGSYGVNLFGHEFYKECMAGGFDRVRRLGVVLGPYHPLVQDNIQRLKRISGQDEVSFHMSGTEAVMQAVRLARYHTGKTRLVRFCGAYHGWWDGVQPGIGTRRRADDVHTLADMSDKTLKVLSTRDDIACVLINALQALHPNADAASDASLVASTRSAGFDRAAYTSWLKRLREVCTRRGIVMIIDEVFTGFRLAYGGAQEYFEVKADIVTFGKTLGGGLPVGVVCGRRDLMRRFKPEQPANPCFARGTFNAHPVVMATMNEFLQRLELPYCQKIYYHLDRLCDERVAALNRRLADLELPLRIENLSSVWTILYTRPCRYNWMFQFYLRKHGILMSWVGSGRVVLSLDIDDAAFEQVMRRFVDAAQDMKAGGWWWTSPALTNRYIKRRMLVDMLRARFGAGAAKPAEAMRPMRADGAR